MDYNTTISKLEEDLERAVHSGDEKQIEAIKYQINYVKKHRFDWFHNGFYDHKTGEWHTMKPDEAEYLANCGRSDDEIVAYVNSREEHTDPFPGYKFDKNPEPNFEVGMYKEPINIDIPSIHPGMNEIGSDVVKELHHDPINHPSHYTQGGIECIEAIEAACTGLTGDEGYYVGQVIKYIWRWKHKNGLQDLEKAEWYLDRLIGNVTAEVIADDLEARNSQ